jgi:DNA-binding beta-propeller fold protein YncE
VGRADVWVFDATDLGTSLGGTPLTIVTLFADTPRALAVSPDGNTVYAAAFHSGNQTTALMEQLVCDGGAAAPACTVGGSMMPGGLPAPNTNFQGTQQPETGLIVKFDESVGQWQDTIGRNWNTAVRFALPDKDVFAIDATANPPAQTGFFTHVGTILFNMVANPVSGKVYITNTDANNLQRFEGPGTFAGSTVRGHLHEARITVLDGASVLPRRLNKNIDYSVVPSPPGVKDDSLAIPNGMAITSDGATLYVAAFGSSKVGVFSTAAIENDTFISSALDHIPVSGGGPSGLVLDEPNHRLYVFTRFDDGVSVIDTSSNAEVAHLTVYNPEPASVVNGRPFLYDARTTSSNGEASCASCHVFGDFDSLAWDLGNPDGTPLNDPNPFVVGGPSPFAPLKGPMTTQSLRGMANNGPMHWRGDRTGGNDPGGSALDESAAFEKFNVAFDSLLGLGAQLTDAQMQAFTDFILQVTYPPNPIRNLDDSLTNAQLNGSTNFSLLSGTDAGTFSCNDCHVLNPSAGAFGTAGRSSFENEPQNFKIPHLRNAYQKVGKFGMPQVPFIRAGNNGFLGDQVRGFGFLHDGSVDTLFRFHQVALFNLTAQQAQDLEQFVLAFDSDLAPIVGQQITLTATNAATTGPRIDLLIARAAAGECDLVVKGNHMGLQRGWLRQASGSFRSDRTSEPLLTDAQLRAQTGAAGEERTYTCVPPGSGLRVGVDRDEDGFFDRDEIDAGSDPADPSSVPAGGTTTTSTITSTTTSTTFPVTFSVVLVETTKLQRSEQQKPSGTVDRYSFTSSTKKDLSPNRIVPPPRGSANDPTVAGGVLLMYNAAGLTGDMDLYPLPAVGWHYLGTNSLGGYAFVGKAVPGGTTDVTKLVLKPDKITAKGFGPYSLDEPQQGRIAVLVVVGSGNPIVWCTSAPAKTSGNPPSTAKSDHPGLFRAQPKTPAPAFCPALP